MTFDLINYDRDILISTIELVNFMCHDHLVVNFKKKFTCIGGRNGSGKSAIMISLGILFGLRSSSLERGNSLKNLIKSGESFFIIRCVINNTKKFMYETFGDCIIVEKKVTTKSSTFSVVNKDRKVIFNKVDDLEYLLNFYDLKFDNPLNFLTQEMAKRFLSSSDPKVLYQLFLKATEISDIRTINEEYKNNVDIMKNKIEEVKKELEVINDKIMDETKRLEILSNVGKLEKKIKDCNIEIEWSRIDKIRTEALVIQNELNEMSNEIKRKQDDLTSIMEESELIKQDKKNLNDENKLLQEKNAKRLEEVERDVNSKTIKIRSIEHDLEELQKEFAYKEDLIHKYELSNSFVDKRDVLYEQKNKTMTRINSLDERLNNLKYVCNKKESQRDQEIENQRNHEKNIYRIKKQLEFISKSGDQASMHPKIDVIVKEISSTKFRDIVIGPIGNYIKVKDQKWAKVVSILTHKILTNFICFNQNDRELLHSIFRKHNVSFSVQMPSSKMDKLIDYRSNNNYTTLLDVISVSSTIVLNQLIIMLSIERIVLVTSREKAYSVMKESPKYVDCIYLPYGDIVKKIGGSLSDFSSKRMERYYFENASDKKNDLQRELKALNDNKPSMSIAHEYDKLKNEIRDINMEKSELERLISKINNEIDNAEKLFATQKEIMSNENVYEDKKVIEKQIKVLENKIQKTKNEIQMLELEKEEIQNTSYRSVVDLDKQLIEKQTKFQRLNLEINNMIIKKLKIEQNYKNTMGSYESKRFELLEKYKEVVNPREECIVNDDIVRLNTEVQEINKIGTAEDSEVARSHLIEAKKVKEQFLSLYQQKTENLLISLQSRIEKREYLKDHISKCASESFKQITSERGYSGDLIFDHTNESLFLKMKVHNLQVAGSKETLSGGERSFAAMSMLLSLWPHVSCPVKILDEFDVFMDNLNRKFVIEKFKSYFLSSNNQVILITPLNTNELAHPNIKIVSLKSPVRKEAVPSG